MSTLDAAILAALIPIPLVLAIVPSIYSYLPLALSQSALFPLPFLLLLARLAALKMECKEAPTSVAQLMHRYFYAPFVQHVVFRIMNRVQLMVVTLLGPEATLVSSPKPNHACLNC